MTTYELPAEPDVDVLWTQDQDTGAPIRWDRVAVAHVTPNHMWEATDGTRTNWRGVLDVGPVHDTHPTLSAAQSTPWRLAFEGSDDVELRDVKNQYVDFHQEANLALIQLAVNAYAEGLR